MNFPRFYVNVVTAVVLLGTAFEGLKQGVYRQQVAARIGGPSDVWLALGIAAWAFVLIGVNVWAAIIEELDK